MVTAEAAYCSICGVYVFVGPEGGCEHGHPRSALYAVYYAEVDARTGLPKPPQHTTPRRFTPVAPIAPRVQPMAAQRTRVSTFSFPMHHDVASAVIWPPAFTGMVDGVVARMFAPPKGKHSAASGTHRAGRGRHSAVVVRDARRTALRAALVAGSAAAGVVGLLAVL